MEALSILLVDDEKPVLDALRRSLTSRGARVTALTSPGLALQLLADVQFSAVVSDLAIPEMHGLDFLGHCREVQPEAFRVALTGAATLDVALRALNGCVAHKFFLKPWDGVEIDALLAEVGDRRRPSVPRGVVLADPAPFYARRAPYQPPPTWTTRMPDTWRQALGLLATRSREAA